MAEPGSRNRLANAADAFTSNARNPQLRRAQLSFLGAWTAEWAFTVALGIVAYRDGGATALGLVGLLRMVPAAVLRSAALAAGRPGAPRTRPDRGLHRARDGHRRGGSGGCGLRSTCRGLRAGSPLDDRSNPLPAGALRPAPVAVPHGQRAGECQRGARAARLRCHPRRTAARGGPPGGRRRLGGVLGRGGVVWWAALLLLRLRYDAPPRPSVSTRPRLVREAAEGVRAVARNRGLSLVLGLAAAQSFTRGALTVLSVVVAIELLGTGEPGAGALMTAVGVGAVLGSLAASLLVGTRGLGVWFAVGVALWGLPIALVGVVPHEGGGARPHLPRRRRQRADRRRRRSP